MTRKVDFSKAQILAPTPVVLVGCAHRDIGRNVLTVAWCGVDCSEPPVVHVSVRPSRYSHRIIKESGVFTVNIPTRELLRQVDICGTVSGRYGDKFERAGLTASPGGVVEAPIVAECPVNLECTVLHVLPLGAHDMFVGEIVARHADESLVTDGRVAFEKLSLIAYVLGEYWSLGQKIGDYGFTSK
jgi:flavin reductase (DIM6/NTAB) family NADH-FMN oxidoreductase RutF